MNRMLLPLMSMFFMLTSSWPAQAVLMNSDQHRELFVHGTITDESGKVWKVKIIPGSKNIKDNAVEAWNKAKKDLTDYVSVEYWRDTVADSFLDGARFAKDSLVKNGLYEIHGYYTETRKENGELDPETFGLTFIKVYNWLKFSGKTLATTIKSAFCFTGGVAYSVVAPGVAVAFKPLSSLWHAGVEGSVYPAAVFVWNGTAWVGTYYSHVPKKANFWVVLSDNTGSSYTLDLHGLSALVSGSIATYLTEAQIEAVNARRKEIEDLRRKLNENDQYLLMRNIINEALLHEHAGMAADAALNMEEDRLREMVKEALVKMEVKDVTDAQIEAIMKTIKGNLKELLKDESLSPQ